MFSQNKSFTIASHGGHKRFEDFYLFGLKNDELYGLSKEAYPFLLRRSRSNRLSVRKLEKTFVIPCHWMNQNHVRGEMALAARKRGLR